MISPLGNIPTDWSLGRLGDLTVKIGSGATPTGGEQVYLPKRHHFALIRSQAVHDRYFDLSALSYITDEDAGRLANAEVRPDDVLLNITGDGVTFARASMVPHEALPACVNQHVSIIRTDPKKLVPGFLLSYLTHPEIKGYVGSFNAGGSRRAITKGHIESFVIPLPPLPEQEAISSLLRLFDSKIELDRQINTNLETVMRAIFKDWFVDFGPTRSKLEEDEPYVSTDLWDLFPASLDGDDKPTGWDRVNVGKLLESTIGGDWGREAPDADFSTRVYIVRGTDLPRLKSGIRLDAVPTRYVQRSKVETRALSPGDIVLEISGGSPTQPTGRSLLFTKELLGRFDAPVLPASFCRRLRPRSTQMTYLLALHMDALYQRGGTWKYQNQSTGLSNFQTTHFLDNETVIVPSAEVLEKFVFSVESNFRKTQSSEGVVLSKLRDLLLPKLMSGELRLKSVDSSVGDAL